MKKALLQGRRVSKTFVQGQIKNTVLRAEEFGFVFQQTHLVSNLTLYENVAVAGFVSKKGNTEEMRNRAKELLSQMGIEKAGDRLPSQVSGGEAQRGGYCQSHEGQTRSFIRRCKLYHGIKLCTQCIE